MYPTTPDPASFSQFKDKVVVVTGGASGIGAALTELLYRHGAHMVFGDVNVEGGNAFLQSLTTKHAATEATGTAVFVPCDVTKYTDIYELFRTALDGSGGGRVDHAVSCAGIAEDPRVSYFDAALDVNSVREDQGSLKPVEVNLCGSCYFARIALPFLRHGRQTETEESDKSLTLLSSVTGFRDAPGMFLYQTSKQATLGLMRSMRAAIHARDHIRVNAVCPGMTESAMTAPFIDLFRNNKSRFPAHYQTSDDVARHLAAVMLAKGLNGRSIYVEEGRGWDFEEGLSREMPRWLGEEPTRLSDENLRFIESLGGI